MLVQLKDRPVWGFARAQEIAADGRLVRRAKPLAVQFPRSCVGATNPGTVWSVEGDLSTRTLVRHGYSIEQEVVKARSATLRRVSGDLLARWIARNVTGIGEVIARRLVRALPDLDRCVRDHDVKALCSVAGLSERRARALIDEWPTEGLYDVLEWLQRAELPLGLGERLCRVYGTSALEVLERDPFSLLGFGVAFRDVLAIADSLGIDVDGDRMLVGLVEYAAGRFAARTGSTVMTEAGLMREAGSLSTGVEARKIANAPNLACKAGAIIAVPGGYQAIGHALMERRVARVLHLAATRRAGHGSLFAAWENRVSELDVVEAISKSESRLPFRLTAEQRRVVTEAVQCRVAVITGEAGTGKTTIVRAILGVYDEIAGIPIFQVALSGRAARRMTEATGRPASTIAKLVAEHIGEHKPKLPEHLLLVVDEVSMVDLLSAYRLVGVLPAAARILLIGDVAQLPPVGPGVVFHALMDSGLPVFRLSQVKRHGEGSEIHQFARAIRRGNVPDMAVLDQGLDLAGSVAYTTDMRPEHVWHLWAQAGGAGRAKILSPIRKGPGGVEEINAHLQRKIGTSRPMVHYGDHARGWIPWLGPQGRSVHLHDQVMVTANDYDADVRNGDIGTIVEVFESPGESGSGGWLDIDGRQIPLTVDLLSVLTLGYAVTVHKSQGSQWPICIVMLPPRATAMVDRTLLYTAATRAVEKLVLCGDRKLVDRAVRSSWRALDRRTNLTEYLKNLGERWDQISQV